MERVKLCCNCSSWAVYPDLPSWGRCIYDDGFTCTLNETYYAQPCVFGTSDKVVASTQKCISYNSKDKLNQLIRDKLSKIQGITEEIIQFIVKNREQIDYYINLSKKELVWDPHSNKPEKE
jgi:hypothetical protein